MLLAAHLGFDSGSDDATAIATTAAGLQASSRTPQAEPNNTPGSADPITLGSVTDPLFLNGSSIDPSGDLDYFRFTVGGSGTVRFDIDAIETRLSNLDSVLQLYGPDGTSQIASNDDATDPDSGFRGLDAALEHYLDAGGEYFIRVRGFGSSTGAYQLEGSFEPDAPAGDPFEVNNSRETATPITGQNPLSLSVTGGAINNTPGNDRDQDWYSFTVASAGTVTLDIDAREQGLSTLDSVVVLHDTSGAQLAINDDGVDPQSGFRGLDSALSFHVDAGGTYFAVVRGFGSSEGAYTLNIDIDPDVVGDPFEQNGDFDPATSLDGLGLQPGVVLNVSSAIIDPAGDRDFFSFDMPGPGRIVLDTDARETGLSSVDTVVTLYDANRQVIARNDDGVDPFSGYRGLDSGLEHSVTAAGQYFVEVRGFGSSVGAYELQLLIDPRIGGDPNEENGSFSNATSLTVSPNVPSRTNTAALAQAGGDLDYYTFELGSAGVVSLDIDARETSLSSVDTVVELYVQTGGEPRLLAANDDGVDPQTGYRGLDSALSHHVDGPGTYFVLVRGFSTSSAGRYDLETIFVPDQNTDPYEDNNTIETAAELAVQPGRDFLTDGARIDPSGESDFYQFTTAGAGPVTLDIDAREIELSGLDSILTAYTSDGQIIDRNDDGVDPMTGYRGLDSALTFFAPAAGTYIVQVTGFGGSTGEYSLRILSEVESTGDPFESNDSFATASELFVSDGVSTSTGAAAIDPAGDDDYYRFSLNGGGLLTLDIDARETGLSTIDSVVELYRAGAAGADPVLLGANDDGVDPQSGYRGLDSALVTHVDAGGDFFVRVRGFGNRSTGLYDLRVLFEANRDVDPFEQNNTIATASVLRTRPGVLLTTTGALIDPANDLDFFAIDVAAESSVVLDIDARETGRSTLDSVVALIGADGTVIAENDDAVDPQSGYRGLDSALERVVPAGRYFVRVSSFATRSTGAYDLQILVTPTGAAGGGDIGDTIATATAGNLQAGRTYSRDSDIGEGSDVDMFAFDLSRIGGPTIIGLDIDARETGSRLDSVLRIFNAAGTELARNDDGVDPDSGYRGVDSALTYLIDTPGIYYVGVSSYRNFGYDPTVAASGGGSSTGNYTLRATLQAGQSEPPPRPTPNPTPRPNPVAEQTVWLNFGGGEVDLFGRHRIPRFEASDVGLPAGQRQAIIDAVVAAVRDDFITSGSFENPDRAAESTDQFGNHAADFGSVLDDGHRRQPPDREHPGGRTV